MHLGVARGGKVLAFLHLGVAEVEKVWEPRSIVPSNFLGVNIHRIFKRNNGKIGLIRPN